MFKYEVTIANSRVKEGLVLGNGHDFANFLNCWLMINTFQYHLRVAENKNWLASFREESISRSSSQERIRTGEYWYTIYNLSGKIYNRVCVFPTNSHPKENSHERSFKILKNTPEKTLYTFFKEGELY